MTQSQANASPAEKQGIYREQQFFGGGFDVSRARIAAFSVACLQIP
jgi:hypothetical protein